VQAGVPTGGRFAAQKRDESEVRLVAGELINGRTIVDPRAAIEYAIMYAKFKDRKSPHHSLPWEDIAQEALASVRTTIRNGRADGFTPGLISVAVSQMTSASINTKEKIRHEDAKASQMLREAVDIEEEMLGRNLTNREVIGLADRIRDTWVNPRHRPQREFYRRFMEVPIDSLLDSSILENALHSLAGQHVDERNSASELATDIESGHIAKSAGRARAWDALAGIWDVPRVSQTQSKEDAKTGQKVVEFNGGVSAVINAYRVDRVLTPEARAVFAPFGKPDGEGRRAIANELAVRPSVAERLWRSASDGSIAPVPQWNERAFS